MSAFLNLSAVIFDFDGTLTRPGGLDFPAIRKALACPPDAPILEFIASIADPDERIQKEHTLDGIELAAAAASEPNSGAEALIAGLRDRGIPVGLLTRNSRAAVRRALENFATLDESHFTAIVSRDDDILPKPNPAGIYLAANMLCHNVQDIMMVGDYLYDIQAGHAAGCKTAYLSNGSEVPKMPVTPDVVVEHLRDLEGMLKGIVRN